MNLPFWLELLVRSSALLLAGEIILRLSKLASAALRHRFLAWVLALLALLPVFSALFPEISVSLWRSAPATRALVTVVEVSSRTATAGGRHSVNWLLVIWAVGAISAFIPLIVGAISVWRIGRRAKPFGGESQVLISHELRIPVTCGIWRPRILLPAEAMHWSSARLKAVLLHERAHIRRKDVATQLAAHFIASLWWFQPMVWVTRRRLRRESEFACDAAAVGEGFKASDYASELLAVAKSAGRDWRVPGSAIAMVRAGDLEARVRAVLSTRDGLPRPSRSYLLGLGLVLGSAGVAASAVDFHLSEQGGSSMKRTILSALLTSAGLSAATVSGTVHDANGVAVADAKVTMGKADMADKQEGVTTADGKFSLSGSDAGQYILRIEKPGFASIFREFDLKAESAMNREFTMPGEGGQAVADASITPDTGDTEKPKKVRVGGQVAQSNLIQKVQPTYPMAAKAAHTQGTVELEATISKDGVPVELRVVSSPSDDLSQSSLDAVSQWRYRPTLLNGEPVEIVTKVVVNYTLSQ